MAARRSRYSTTRGRGGVDFDGWRWCRVMWWWSNAVEDCSGAMREVDGTGAGRPCSARLSKIHPKSCSRGRAVMVNREGVSQ